MSENNKSEKVIAPHHDGCGCHPDLLRFMLESAAAGISRRFFIKSAGVMLGASVTGGISSSGAAPIQDHVDSMEADIIYHNGSIITMLDEQDQKEAIAIVKGQILATGTFADILLYKGKNTRFVDLEGKTLMPGFIDPHSHLALQSIKFSCANLDPTPIGMAGSISDIQQILQEWINNQPVKKGDWVIGWGYDDTGIQEKRHPDRDDLDAVSTEYPVLLVHISGHIMSCNSKVLEILGVNADTADPLGGKLQRRPGTNEPNGVLEENAMYLLLPKLPVPSAEEAIAIVDRGLRHYAAAGITTAQDCATFKGTWKLLDIMDKKGLLPIDVIAWPLYKDIDDKTFEQILVRQGGKRRLRQGGIKLTVDGSIQGYTAFLTRPYHTQPAGQRITADKCSDEYTQRLFLSDVRKPEKTGAVLPAAETNRGYPALSQSELDLWIKRCDEHNIPVQVHCNGDAAADMLFSAVEKSRGDIPRPDLRTTVIHGQTLREDQLDKIARYGLSPSYFPIHVYFWGDRHRDIFLGPERASRINPARSTLDRNIKMTLHHDAPIAGVDMLKVIWSAVNRLTSGGTLLGPEQCITPFEALKAITADAAWQNFEEFRKGTLEKGKMADFVILSDNPLSIDPLLIKDIQVIETIKEGITVYSSKGSS